MDPAPRLVMQTAEGKTIAAQCLEAATEIVENMIDDELMNQSTDELDAHAAMTDHFEVLPTSDTDTEPPLSQRGYAHE